MVLSTLETRRRQNTSGVLGYVRLKGKVSEVMAAVVVEGSVTVPPGVDRCVVVEHPSNSALPGGVFVKRCLLILPKKMPYHLPVVLTNETEHDIAIPPRCTVAELHVVESLLPPPNSPSDDEPLPVKELDFNLNFGESNYLKSGRTVSLKTQRNARGFQQARLRLWSHSKGETLHTVE